MAEETKNAAPGQTQPASTAPKTGPGPHNDADNIATVDAEGKEKTSQVQMNQQVASVQTARTLPESATDQDFGHTHPNLGPGEVDVKSAKPLDGRATVLTSAGELDREAVIANKVAGTGVVHVHTLGPTGVEEESKEADKGVRE